MNRTIAGLQLMPPTLNVAKAADLMEVSEWHLRRLLRDGKIEARKVGKGWRIPTVNALEYMGIKTE